MLALVVTLVYILFNLSTEVFYKKLVSFDLVKQPSLAGIPDTKNNVQRNKFRIWYIMRCL